MWLMSLLLILAIRNRLTNTVNVDLSFLKELCGKYNIQVYCTHHFSKTRKTLFSLGSKKVNRRANCVSTQV